MNQPLQPAQIDALIGQAADGLAGAVGAGHRVIVLVANEVGTAITYHCTARGPNLGVLGLLKIGDVVVTKMMLGEPSRPGLTGPLGLAPGYPPPPWTASGGPVSGRWPQG